MTVVVVGAGPAGASLAYLLASRGVETTLIERRRDFDREFRGEVLMPSGVDALQQMGLSLADVPHRRMERARVYMNRRAALDFAIPDREILAVSQPALLEALVSAASRYPNFRWLDGTALRGLDVRNGRTVGVHVRGDDGARTLAADVVVGTDGRNSAVRRELGASAVEASPPLDVVWCKVPLPEAWKGVRAYAGRGHLLVAYQAWDDALQMGWVILKGTFHELRAAGIEAWVEEMARHVDDDLGQHLNAHLDQLQRPFLLEAVSDCVQSWWRPGVLLLGDAAHTMSPVGGQGINVALRDAIVAANHLIPALEVGDAGALGDALAHIEAERRLEIEQVQAFQAQPPKLVLSRAWWAEPLRRILGQLVSRPAVQRRALDRLSFFFDGVTDVQLKV